jgi:hypothetical protein
MGLAQSVLAWFLGTSIEQSQVRTKTAAQLRSRFYILYNMLDHPAPHQIVVSHLYLGLKLDGRLPLAVTSGWTFPASKSQKVSEHGKAAAHLHFPRSAKAGHAVANVYTAVWWTL